jgi:hypothetical protein
MFAPLIAKAKGDCGRHKAPISERTLGKLPTIARTHGQPGNMAGLPLPSSATWNFSGLRLAWPDRPYPFGAKAIARDEGSPEEKESESPCGDRASAPDLIVTSDCTAPRGKPCGCAKCSSDEPQAPVPVQSPPASPPAHTFTFISRESYGETTPNITRPACTDNVDGTMTMSAGSAAPVITVFPQGRYQVRRDDGVQQTATCNRLAAGMARTRTHEESHVRGVNNGVAAANTAAGGLPHNFATAAACATALGTWNTSVNAVLANEAAHGPGTDPPTPQTFAGENAAGGCTFV